VHAFQRLDDGDQNIYDVVQFKYPNKPDLTTPAENVVVGYVTLPTGLIKLLICRQLHEIVVKGYEQLLRDKVLQLFALRLNFIMFELAGLGKYLYLLVENNVTNVVSAYLANLYEGHHYFKLSAAAPLLFELLYQNLKEMLFLGLLALLLEHLDCLADHLGSKAVGCKIDLLELLMQGVLFEESVDKFHNTI
jgi:hypothetical protein